MAFAHLDQLEQNRHAGNEQNDEEENEEEEENEDKEEEEEEEEENGEEDRSAVSFANLLAMWRYALTPFQLASLHSFSLHHLARDLTDQRYLSKEARIQRVLQSADGNLFFFLFLVHPARFHTYSLIY